jgi:hypothetical protein
MPIPQQNQRSAPFGLSLAGAALVLSLAATTASRADVIRAEDMLQGVVITQAQCAALPTAVWVRVLNRPFCVRYYLSTAGGDGRRPVVFLEGDKLGKMDGRTRNFHDPNKVKDVDTARLDKFADMISKWTKTTGIYLARIGVDGTSGHHSARKTLLELYLMNAALDAIKKRHGFEGFHLFGQSGGAILTTGLAGLRSDVACAVPGAGAIARAPKRPGPAADRSLDYFDPAEAIPAIVKNRSLRLLVVTDPADQTVPGHLQNAFVQRLRQAGGKVEQFLVETTTEKRHGVTPYSQFVVAGCVRGASDQEIASKLAKYVERRVAAAKAKKAEQSGANANGSAVPRQPADPRTAPSSEASRPGGRLQWPPRPQN